MKISAGLFVPIFGEEIGSSLRPRRYHQLADMMNFYNPDFDEKKYWAYGCNCLIIGKIFRLIYFIRES